MAVVAAFISPLLFSVADFAGGFATRRTPARKVVLFSQTAGLVTVIAVAALAVAESVSPADHGWGAAGGILGMIGLLFFYQGMADRRVSVVSPLAGLTGAGVPILFGLVTGERPRLMAAIGVLLALPPILLISTMPAASWEGSLWRGGAMYGLAGGAGFGGCFVLISRAASGSGLWPLVSARATTVGVMGLLLIVTRSIRPPPTVQLPLIVAVGVTDVLANMAFLIATRGTLLVLAAVITALYPASTLLLARVVLGERTSPVQRLGLSFAAAAVVAIALG
ncbi:MAG: EamA/RhaT family transporter [Acidimicrobiia bacterium]|nr:EamA/RhaT family transporter [Acidimicrobiia bacterium]